MPRMLGVLVTGAFAPGALVLRALALAAFVLAASVPRAASAMPAFESPFASYTVGSTPRLVAVADFDGDGIPDVAVSTFEPLAVTIRRGTGDGTLQSDTTVLPTGTFARAMRVADFDADGRPDLVVAGLSRVRVFRNTTVAGVLQFTPADVVVDAVDRRDLATGDFDGDGKIDFAVFEQAGFTTRAVMYRNDGTARFNLTFTSDLLQDVSWVAGADFDGDGRLDLAVSGGTLLAVFGGRGNGTFGLASRYVFDRDTGPVAAGDFDADGMPDVAMGGASGRVIVCRGTGDGSFAAPWVDSHGTDAVTWLGTADVTRDGRLDLFVVRQAANRIELLAGRGDATFAESSRSATGLAPFGAATADLDGDGRWDAVVCNTASRSIAVIHSQGGEWGRSTTIPVAPGPSYLAAADLDRNGTPDLVTLHPESGEMAVCLGGGSVGFAPVHVVHVGGSPRALVLGDFNGDGRTDAVIADPASTGLRFLDGDGAGGFGAGRELRVDGHPETCAATDLDADGVPDLLAAEPRGAEQPLHFVSVLRGTGGGWFDPPLAFELPSGAAALAAGDVDGDGAVDVVAACPQADAVVFLLGNGDGTLRPALRFAAGTRPSSVAVADLDTDGRPEIVVGHAGLRGITIVRWGAHGAETAAEIATDGDAASVGARDLDRDGWPDLIAVRALTGQLLVFPGGPGLAFTSRLDLGAGNASQVIAADTNGDLLADLLYPDAAAGAIVLLRNASVTTPVTIGDVRLEQTGNRWLLHWRLSGDPIAGIRAVRVECAETAAGPWTAAGPELAPEASMSSPLETPAGGAWFRVALRWWSGAVTASGPFYVAPDAGRTQLARADEAPDGSVRIAFALARAARVQWTVFDVRGRSVWHEAGDFGAGLQTLVWTRRGTAGERVRRGVYWVRMTAPGAVRSRRLVLQHG